MGMPGDSRAHRGRIRMSTAGSSNAIPTAGGNQISGLYPSMSATMTIPQKSTKAGTG